MSETQSSETPVEFVQPRKVTQLLAVGLAMIAVGLDFAWETWAFPGIKSWIANAATDAAREERFAFVVAGMLGGIAVFSIAVAVWFWVMSVRISRHSLFPPAGYPVLVKTAIVRGAAATRQARMHMVLGIVVIALCIFVLTSIFMIFPVAAILWGGGTPSL